MFWGKFFADKFFYNGYWGRTPVVGADEKSSKARKRVRDEELRTEDRELLMIIKIIVESGVLV